MYKVAAYNKKKNGMSETENFPYRVRLGLQHVFNPEIPSSRNYKIFIYIIILFFIYIF